MLGVVVVEEVGVREEGLAELGFGYKGIEDEVVDGVGLMERPEPEVGLRVRTGGVCFTG